MSTVICAVELGAVGLLAVGWLLRQAAGELRFWLEHRACGRAIPPPLELPPLKPGAIVVDVVDRP